MSGSHPGIPAALRPKLRPTLSRKVKYWGIAPSAQKKLGKEARRGSHDLRRLVGHANFLDELVEEFHIDDREQDPRRQQKVVLPKSKASEERLAAAALSPQKPKSKPQEKPVEYDDDEDTASDSWSECDDSDDDTGHALVRTESGRSRPVEEDLSSDDEDIYGIVPQLTKSGETSTNTSPESLFEGINDYFNHREPSSKVAPDEHPDKQVNAADVEVVSPGAVHA